MWCVSASVAEPPSPGAWRAERSERARTHARLRRLHLEPRTTACLRGGRRASAQGGDRRTVADCLLADPETDVASGDAEAAMCVQDVDVQCVLQFTLVHAASCALHRHASRVIHRLES